MTVPKLRFPEFRDAGEWEVKAIRELFDLEKKPQKATTFDNQKIITVKLHTLGVMKNERTNTLTGGTNYFIRYAGQFIFSKIDLLHGAFGIVPDELDGFVSSSDVPTFTFKNKSSSIFFLYWLKANYLNLVIERTGTSNTLKRVSPEKLLNTPIPLPNIKEQQTIADCLASLDDRITAETQKLDTLKAHKKGLMQQLFPAEGETLPKLRFPEFEDAGEWEEKAIRELFDLEKKPQKATTFDNQKIITVKLHTLGVMKNERTNTLTGGTNYFIRYAGQFIFSKIDLLHGAFGIVPDELDGFVSSSDVPTFTFKNKSSSIFFLYWLKANYLNLVIERTGTSNTLKRVSPEKLLNTPIPLPNIKEQQTIADCLASLDDRITAETEKLDTLKAHKKGLMQQLFPSIE